MAKSSSAWRGRSRSQSIERRRQAADEDVARGEDFGALRRQTAHGILAVRPGDVDAAQAAHRRLADSERGAVIGQRLDSAMDEHPSRLDPAPPRQRLEVILRLDDFVQVEQLADAVDGVGVVADVLVGHDDFVAAGDVDGGADGVDRRR